MNSSSCPPPAPPRARRAAEPHRQQAARPLQDVGRDVGRPGSRRRAPAPPCDSIRFRSWRTLPGQGAFTSRCMRLGRDAAEGAVVLPGQLADEPADQERDVLPPLAQRREVDVEDVEPVVEVVAELAQRDRVAERAVGGGEHPDVHLDRLGAAHPEEGAALEHPQQLDLGGGRDLADLVEEDGAGVGQLEPAQPPLGGAGEGALLVAEQLALEQGVGQRGAVDGDERLAAARARGRGCALATSSLPVPLSPWISTVLETGAICSILTSTSWIGGALADDAGALLQPAALDQPARGGHRVVGRHRLHHGLGDAEPADPLGALGVGGLEQGEGGDLGVAGQRGELDGVRLVDAAGEDHQLGALAPDGAAGVVERGEHGGGEAGRLEAPR